MGIKSGLFKAKQETNRLDYLSPSKMSLLLANPRKFFWKYAPGRGLKEKKTKALKVGDFAHKCLLDQYAWSRLIVEKEFSGKGSVAARAEWLATLPAGAVVISEDERESTLRMVDSVMSDAEARALLEGASGLNEVHAYAQRPDGIWLHGIMDRIISGPAVIEFKTTSGAVDWASFEWDIFEYDYALALATYIEIVGILEKRKVTESAWIVAQSVEPYSVRVHYPEDENMLDLGRFDMERAITRWKELTALDPGLTQERVWFGAKNAQEEQPAQFSYHIMIRKPEWREFLTKG